MNNAAYIRGLETDPDETNNAANLTLTATGTVAVAPTVTTLAATTITGTSATLNGTVNANGGSAAISFDYGTGSSYGTNVAGLPTPVTGSTDTAVSVTLTGLSPATTYHFRVDGTNSAGTSNGGDLTFTTSNIVAATFNAATDVPITADSFTATGDTLSLTLGFAPVTGQVLTLVNNTGSSPIIGTFTGLPEGSLLGASYGGNTYSFAISYTGGDGNDITLTRVENHGYRLIAKGIDGGGGRSVSARYTADLSIPTLAGISTGNAPEAIAKYGYPGQLYDTAGFALNSASVTATVNETGTLQLAAWQVLDDSSFLAVDAGAVDWSVVSGPITGISSTGLATAGAVYQSTPATVQGVYSGLAGQLNLTVLDSIPDNFGSYAGDGLDDAWQVQYFGLPPNTQAGPNVDADGTGQTNLFKYVAGLNPLDGSRFTITIAPVPGQPQQQSVIFSPIVAGRTYTVTAKTNLNSVGGWQPISASTPSDHGSQRTVTDLSATGAAKFYHVEITKP